MDWKMIMRRHAIAILMLLAATACWPLSATAQEAAEEPPAPRVSGPRSWLGVWLGDAVDGGVQVVALVPQGPADKAGLRSGDIILRANEAEVGDQAALSRLLARLSPGDSLDLAVLRSGEALQLPVELGNWKFRVRAHAAEPPARPAPTINLDIPRGYRLESFVHEEPLGVQVAEITPMLRQHYGAPGDTGVLIVRIDPDKPGGKAGLAVGDILVRVDGQEISDRAELEERLVKWQGDQPLQLQIIRGSEPRAVSVTTTVRVQQSNEPVALRAPASPEEMALVQKRLESEIKRLERRLQELQRILAEIEQPED
jgi:predicted metalloprotease with PDZ domain